MGGFSALANWVLARVMYVVGTCTFRLKVYLNRFIAGNRYWKNMDGKNGKFFNQELFVLFFEPCFSQGRAGDWSKVLTIFGIKGKGFMTLKMTDEIWGKDSHERSYVFLKFMPVFTNWCKTCT